MEEKTGRVLYEKNSQRKMLIASTTKIMTAIIVIENAKLTEIVKVGKETTNTETEAKEPTAKGDKAEEEILEEETEDELDILLNRLQTGKGVQKSVYIEEDVYNFIQAKCEKTNAKFSNVFNLLARSAIKQQNKK
mgnify:CR=1 FL=1